MITWTIFADEAARVYGPGTTAGDLLGFLPEILRPEDPRPVKEQLEDRYAHGGGWRPFGKDQWELSEDYTLTYPGDPALKPIAGLSLPHSMEIVLLYPHQMAAIIQADRSFEVARLD
jgi:hypothetical protein